MGKLSEKQLTVVTIAVAIVVTGVFTTLIYLDFQTIEEEKVRAAKADTNIRKAQVEIDKMREREQNVIIFREVVKRDAQVLPDEDEIGDFWRKIKEFKDLSGVQIDRIDGLDKSRSKKKKGKGGGQAITPLNIRLSLKGDMEQTLNFMNRFENFDRLVTINNVGMSVGRYSKKSKGGGDSVQHSVSLNLTTYVYNPRGGAVKQVEIKNYDQRVEDEEIKRGIQKFAKPKKEEYTLRPNLDRRDPLVSPRRSPDVVEEGKTLQQIYEEQKNLLDRLVLQFQFIEQDVEIERELLSNRDFIPHARMSQDLDKRILSLEDEISKVSQQKMISIDELNTEFEQEIVTPFRKLQSERVSKGPAVPLTVNLREVRNTLDAMRAAFDKAAYTKVLDTYQSYKIYREGREVDADASRIEEEIVEMARRATVVSDFESRQISISALIVGPTRSVALINGKSVAEGDPIEAGSKILLQEVRSDGCTFLYEGVEIARTTKRATGK